MSRFPGPADITAMELAFSGACSFDVPLDRISRWKIGGEAKVVLTPRSVDELSRMRAFCSQRELSSIIIGSTTNLLFSDQGIKAVVLQLSASISKLHVVGNQVEAEAGIWVPCLARKMMQAGLYGLEHTAGIPGTLGGLVCMNGGSLRRGIGDHIDRVETLDQEGIKRLYEATDCDFGYRQSIFQVCDEVIVRVWLTLEEGREPLAQRQARIRRTMLDIMGSRRRKFPGRLPNCGSVFVSNPAMYDAYGPPGAIIERLGFKGKRVGGAEVSPIHANFIVNIGGAKARDVLILITQVKDRVRHETGYDMAVEARYVDVDGTMIPADELALAMLQQKESK